jgi:hypothetical protein
LRDDIRRRRQSVRRIRRHDQTNPTRLNTHSLNGLLRVLFTSVPSALRSSSLLIPGRFRTNPSILFATVGMGIQYFTP